MRIIPIIPALVLAAASGPTTAQNVDGRVTDTAGRPVDGAVVFYDRSTVADTTDADGRFVLPEPPVAYARMVVMADGFATTEERGIAGPSMRAVEVVLERHRDLGPAPEIEDRQGAIDLLEDALFTWSDAGDTCDIVNDAVLRPVWTEPGEHILVTAIEPVIVECGWTGYRITWTDFRFEGDPLNPLWQGRLLFADLPRPHPRAANWAGNRERAYRASFRHFVRSMIRDRLGKELFRAYHTRGIYRDERAPIVEMRQKSRLANTINPVLRDGPSDSTYVVNFSEWVYVAHPFGEAMDRHFIERYYPLGDVRERLLAIRNSDTEGLSWVFLPYGRVTVDQSGVILDYPVSEVVRALGDMGQRRFDFALPIDYPAE